ncbi:MAG: response regulator [Rhizobiales bacterium]|nr:response regulator [Hyphomicrobiales bacterium]
MIAIIDDDVSVRTATSRLVRSLGYHPHTFASADDFLRSQHVSDAWCVLADVQMPGMTGIELQNLLRAQGRTIPMIFITAFFEESIKTRALEAGAVAFLSKPFDGKALVDCIDTALGQSGRQPSGS